MSSSGASRQGATQHEASAEQLVALLRAQLGTGPAPDGTSLARCNWEGFLRLATHHGLTPLLYRSLRDRTPDVPEPVLRRVRLEYFGNAMRNQIVHGFVDEITAALSAAGIAVILLKGAALLRTLYDDVGLRPLGDVDLLVEERDLERADTTLRAVGLQAGGYGHMDERRGPLCHMHVYYCRPTLPSIPVELHWRLFEGYQPYVFDLAAVWSRAEPVPGMPAGVCAMSPPHELAHLCLHLERHAMVYRSLVLRRDWFELLLLPQGLGRLIWLYDIALFLQRRAALDWDELVATARRWAIDAHLHAVLELCRRALGVGPPAPVLAALNRKGPRLADRVAQRVLLASRRAQEERTGWPRSAGPDRATALAPHVLRATHAWSSLFPPPAYLRAAYPTQRGAIPRYAKHLQAVAPELWAEIRERFVTDAAAPPATNVDVTDRSRSRSTRNRP